MESKKWFEEDFNKFFKGSQDSNSRFLTVDKYPCYQDKTSTTEFDSHYIYHPAWATRVVKEISPQFHIDIGSTLHFSSILSAFFTTKFYDYRPANLLLDNLESGSADLTQLFFNTNEVESLSCMHTVEHVGLGRYGDPIDPEGDIKAMKELQRVVKPGGSLLFVTPVGKPKIAFNAHRIYSYKMIIENFNQMEVVEFSMIPDNAMEVGMIRNCPIDLVARQEYACGCFWLKKKNNV